jgi:hypothetical protein
MTDNNDRFESRVRAVFDEGVGRIDGYTRSRLTQARFAAVAELGKPTLWRSGWIPAGTVAVVAVLAMALWLQPGGVGEAPPATSGVTVLADDFELLVVGEDLDLLNEDLEFYAWVAEAELPNGVG